MITSLGWTTGDLRSHWEEEEEVHYQRAGRVWPSLLRLHAFFSFGAFEWSSHLILLSGVAREATDSESGGCNSTGPWYIAPAEPRFHSRLHAASAPA